MENLCDNTSVGVIVRNREGDVLLLNRARFPFGLAPPAGHIDEHGSPEQTAVAEVYEEVGLIVPLAGLRKVIDARRVDNQCRRQNGDHHIWTVYTADNVMGEIAASPDETRGAAWHTLEELQLLANETRANTNMSLQVGARVLELIWLDFFTELGLIDRV